MPLLLTGNTQGLVSKQIWQNKRGYELRGSHEPVVLGSCLEEIRDSSAGNYHNRMRIYRQFCLELVKNRQNLMNDIEEIIANNAANSDPLTYQLGTNPFVEVRSIAELQEPHTRKMIIGR